MAQLSHRYKRMEMVRPLLTSSRVRKLMLVVLYILLQVIVSAVVWTSLVSTSVVDQQSFVRVDERSLKARPSSRLSSFMMTMVQL